MLLDKNTAPVGTRGWVPPATAHELATPEDLKWFIDENVAERRPDGKWAFKGAFESKEDAWAINDATPVYSDWREAIEHTLRREQKDCIDQIDEAVKDLGVIYRVGDMMKDHKEQ